MGLEAGGQSARAIRRAGVRGQRRRGKLGALQPRSRLAEKRVAVQARHRDVAQQHVGRLALQGLDRLRRRLHRAHAGPGLLEHRRDGLAGARVVVHQEHPHALKAGTRAELLAGERRLPRDPARRL